MKVLHYLTSTPRRQVLPLCVIVALCHAPVSGQILFEDHFTGSHSAQWQMEGRGSHEFSGGLLRLKNCEAVAGDSKWRNYELSFRARVPKGQYQAQIWASVRRTARDARYIVGVRGGNNNQIYVARYAPNGRQVFLGTRNLQPGPKPGDWQKVRIVVAGPEIRVFLNQSTVPLMALSDTQAGWLEAGGISIGGGYLETEYDDVVVSEINVQSAVNCELAKTALKLNFQPEDVPPVEGWTKVTGATPSGDRKFGWESSLSKFERRRNKAADPVLDTVISLAGTLHKNEFRYPLANGDYLVTLRTGDPSFATDGKFTFQDNVAETETVSLQAGDSVQLVRKVRITDGTFRLNLERTSSRGISVQALILEPFRDVSKERLTVLYTTSEAGTTPVTEKVERRQRQRAKYHPAVIPVSRAIRRDVPLDGDWLFLPDYQWQAGVNYAALDVDDQEWHIMPVPAFWTPCYNWLYDDKQGGSDRWVQLEQERLGRLTFDWKRTGAAWYRHVLDFKEIPIGQRFELSFEAIAKVSEIWVNGRQVSKSVGMFHPAHVDVTEWVKPGRNVVAVRVASMAASDARTSATKVEDVAVTVAVTERMLKGLPQAIYVGNPGGIWQPVKLVIRPEVHIQDVFFQPRLDGARLELTLENQSAATRTIVPRVQLESKKTGKKLPPLPDYPAVTLKPRETTVVSLDTGTLQPELWTPAKPNLYELQVALQSDSELVDRRKTDVGFRTVETRKDGRIYLNGKPYWLRGGSHTPMPTSPNDAAMADRFTRLMHEANVRVTRSVCAPWNELWLAAADRNGVGVSQEGTWPWLMIGGKRPPEEILGHWRKEHAALIKKCRNHPSILFWTVNNESYYANETDPQIIQEQTGFLSDLIKEMRAIDPTRPICPDSGGVYSMFPPFFEKMAAEKGFDYGDIDDKHEYTSWYMKTFFSHYPNQVFSDGRTGKTLPKQLRHWVTPGRPMISQEFSTGYPNPDDGHTARKYIFDHMVPQAWIGDHAYEHNDPRYFLGSVAFNTKELAETLRCHYRDTMAGVLHFALNTWYQHIFEADRIRPYEIIPALAKGLQPVLVSARLYSRHFYAGEQPEVNVFVVNDDENGRDLKPTRLLWSVEHNGKVLTRGEQEMPAVPYYQNYEARVKLQLPAEIKSPRADCQLLLKLQEHGKTVSQNQYELTIASRKWVQPRQAITVSVLDSGRVSIPLWNAIGVVPRWIDQVPASEDPTMLVINDYTWVQDTAQRQRLLNHVANGGRVILNGPNATLQAILPDLVKSFRPLASGEIATMRVPESPIFDGIEVMDIRWFNTSSRDLPIVTRGDFRLAEDPRIEVLAKYTPTHAYLFKQGQKENIEGAVVFTVRHGRGQFWVTQLAHQTGVHDPIAARLFSNLLESASRPATFANNH